MYRRILVAIEHSPADQAILDHVRQLAKQIGSELHLVHVADGWAARNFDRLQLRESEEMKDDRDYLAMLAAGLRSEGLTVSTDEARLAYQRAADADPYYSDPLYNLGMLALEAGRYGEAIERLERYLRLDARSGWAETAKKAIKLARLSMVQAAAG